MTTHDAGQIGGSSRRKQADIGGNLNCVNAANRARSLVNAGIAGCLLFSTERFKSSRPDHEFTLFIIVLHTSQFFRGHRGGNSVGNFAVKVASLVNPSAVNLEQHFHVFMSHIFSNFKWVCSLRQ